MIARFALPALMLIACISATQTSLTSTASAQVKVAVVDLQRALNETQDGKKAKNQLKGLFKKRQVALDKKQEDLKKMKEGIEKQKDVLNKDVLRQKLESYQKSLVELQTSYVEYQKELAQKEAQLTKGIIDRMQRIVKTISQKDGYTFVVERNEGGVVWAKSSIDITDDVIQRYNKGEGK